MTKLRFGFLVQPCREEIETLERLPIDSLWVGGHVASRNPTPEAMVQLARLAALSTRLRIGTSILLLALYPPAIIAKQIADLDRCTNGRITLGVGVGGEYPQEFRACGVPIAERGRRTNEAIALLRQLWTGEEISHPGPCFPMEQVKIHPTPAQLRGPPIIVAGRKEAAMRRAARLGDGWMPYLYSPKAFRESVGRICAFAAEEGRDLAGFEWMQFLFTVVGADTEAAREGAVRLLGGTYNQDFSPMADRVAAVGAPEQVAARVQEYVDAGARHIIFMVGGGADRLDTMRRIVTEVIPRVSPPSPAPRLADVREDPPS